MTNSHPNTTVVAIFPNVCLWRRSLCLNLVLTLKNCIEPHSYACNASTAYVVAIWPSFLFDSFVKIWATREVFLGKWFSAPPLAKIFPYPYETTIVCERIYRFNSERLRKKEKYATSKWILRNRFCCCSYLSIDDIIHRGQVWKRMWK